MTRLGTVASTVLITSVLMIAVSGCEEGSAEKAGESIDESVEKVGKSLEEAGDSIRDAGRAAGE